MCSLYKEKNIHHSSSLDINAAKIVWARGFSDILGWWKFIPVWNFMHVLLSDGLWLQVGKQEQVSLIHGGLRNTVSKQISREKEVGRICGENIHLVLSSPYTNRDWWLAQQFCTRTRFLFYWLTIRKRFSDLYVLKLRQLSPIAYLIIYWLRKTTKSWMKISQLKKGIAFLILWSWGNGI